MRAVPRRKIITQAEIARAVKGVQAGGVKINRVQIEDGRIVVYSGEDVRPEPASDYDAWRTKRDSRKA
jgi:endonuclease YncB( thermonuclease family)